MSTGKSKTLKRARPAKDAREADSRWGLNNAGHAGAAQRGELDAYTYQHHAEDERTGVIERVARDCPRGRPERDCWPARMPASYLASWTRRGKWRHANGETRVTDLWKGVICYDCRCWLETVERRKFVAEFGSYRLEDGLIDFTSKEERTRRDAADIIAASREMFAREQRALDSLVGLLDEPYAPNERYEQATLLAHARRCLARFQAPKRGVIGIRTSVAA